MADLESKEIADLLFPDTDSSIDEYLAKFPKRILSIDAKVTRFGPSPTGSLHIGGLFTALVSERLAHQSSGLFYLRIEDTDKKREIEGGVEKITSSLEKFCFRIDEGINGIGNYGPYIQSERKNIYLSFIKYMVENGSAYPCFCLPEDLEKTRSIQESQKIRPGYYGDWAKHRKITLDEVRHFLDKGRSFVIRFKSTGDEHNKIVFKDLIKGNISVTENNTDIILLKSDSFPTYHFAHVIDDYLMGTTHVIRGDEWLSSLPIHLQIFSSLKWKAPRYGHLSPILKAENGGKRKLSKRNDPEASVEYYFKEGYPNEAVIEYLLNIANSNFEDWRMDNPNTDNEKFEVKLEKFNKSGALFNLDKLQNISKSIISKMSSFEVYKHSLKWASEYEKGLAKKLRDNKEYFLKIFSIERGLENPRRDISKWSDVENNAFYFFEDLFEKHIADNDYGYPKNFSSEIIKEVLCSYIDFYEESISKDEWFNRVKQFSEKLGFSSDMKKYKENPNDYRGNVSDVAMILRVALTSKSKTPDLYEIMQVMGRDFVQNRLRFATITYPKS